MLNPTSQKLLVDLINSHPPPEATPPLGSCLHCLLPLCSLPRFIKRLASPQNTLFCGLSLIHAPRKPQLWMLQAHSQAELGRLSPSTSLVSHASHRLCETFILYGRTCPIPFTFILAHTLASHHTGEQITSRNAFSVPTPPQCVLTYISIHLPSFPEEKKSSLFLSLGQTLHFSAKSQ